MIDVLCESVYLYITSSLDLFIKTLILYEVLG